MKIFVIGGKSGSGKNEVAKMVNEFYIYKLKNVLQQNLVNILNYLQKNLLTGME